MPVPVGQALENKKRTGMEVVIVLYLMSFARMAIRWEKMNRVGRLVSAVLTLALLALSTAATVKLINH